MKIKNKFKIKKIEYFMFRSFNIRNFEISKYWLFYIWLLERLTPTRRLTINCNNYKKFFKLNIIETREFLLILYKLLKKMV